MEEGEAGRTAGGGGKGGGWGLMGKNGGAKKTEVRKTRWDGRERGIREIRDRVGWGEDVLTCADILH